jgi:hypothetical protein
LDDLIRVPEKVVYFLLGSQDSKIAALNQHIGLGVANYVELFASLPFRWTECAVYAWTKKTLKPFFAKDHRDKKSQQCVYYHTEHCCNAIPNRMSRDFHHSSGGKYLPGGNGTTSDPSNVAK